MHEPRELVVLSRFTRQGGREQRKWAVWYWHLQCPECGRKFVRLANPLRGRSAKCVGRDSLRVTKREVST